MALKPQGNNILAGTSLAIAQIQSPDFVTGVSGWCIFQNGNAEFNSGTFRGFIVGGSLFIYTGTPGLGTLVASITSLTADPFGNVTKPGGLTVYSGAAHLQVHVNSTVSEPAIDMVTGVASEAENGMLYSAPVNTGLVNELIETNLLGPGSTDDKTQGLVQLVSAAADGSSQAGGVFYVIDNTTAVSTPLAFWNSTAGFSILAGSATAVKPGTGTSPANPPASEIWHPMTPFLNGWANVAGFAVAQYRKVASPVNSVEIIGAINAAAASAATFFTLPAGYRPTHQQPVCSMGANAAVPAGLSPWIECTTGGSLAVQNTGGVPAAWESFFHGFISLDA